MNLENNRTLIAYLAPEIPALSATFVYEEILGLEKQGYRIQPFSVRYPASPANGQEMLAKRTIYLYEAGYLGNIFYGLLRGAFFGRGTLRALNWLCADLLGCSVLKASTWKLVYQYMVAVRLAAYLQKLGCTHLHVHFAHVPAQIAMYASAMAKVPFTVTAHANDIFERGLLLKIKAERAAKFLTISEFNRRYLEGLGLPHEKLAVVRCGVSFEMRLQRMANPHQSIFRIGTLGRLVEKKGVDVLIRAVAALRDTPYVVQLSIAGDGPLRQELEQLVKSFDLSDKVVFEGGLPHHKVAEWMQSLDVFVLACKQDGNGDMDGIPVVLMEAMSQCIPVISTKLSGIPELIVHERTGLLAQPGDVDDLARQIEKTLSNSALASKYAADAQAHVDNEFGQGVNFQRLVSYWK